jgi:hypothetical protein
VRIGRPIYRARRGRPGPSSDEPSQVLLPGSWPTGAVQWRIRCQLPRSIGRPTAIMMQDGPVCVHADATLIEQAKESARLVHRDAGVVPIYDCQIQGRRGERRLCRLSPKAPAGLSGPPHGAARAARGCRPQSLQASDSHPSRSQLPAAHAKARRVEESGETARFVLTGRLTRKSSPWRLSDDSLTANPATYCRSLGGRSRIQCLRVSFTLARARAERYRQPPSVARMVSDDHASPGFRPTRLALTA